MTYSELTNSLAIYGDLTGDLSQHRNPSKKWLCIVHSKPWAHTESIFPNGGTTYHFDYSFFNPGSTEPGLTMGGWKLLSARHDNQWYHVLSFILVDPEGNKQAVSKEEILSWIQPHKSLSPTYSYAGREYDSAIGILFLRLVQHLSNWARYRAWKGLKLERETLEKEVRILQQKEVENKLALAEKIKALKSKAKDATKRLASKTSKLEKKITAILTELPSK